MISSAFCSSVPVINKRENNYYVNVFFQGAPDTKTGAQDTFSILTLPPGYFAVFFQVSL